MHAFFIIVLSLSTNRTKSYMSVLTFVFKKCTKTRLRASVIFKFLRESHPGLRYKEREGTRREGKGASLCLGLRPNQNFESRCAPAS
jgi:hypothetical protein